MKSFIKILTAIVLISTLLSCSEDCKFDGISTSSLPDATLGQDYYYKLQLDASCDIVFRSFVLQDGDLPKGISLESTGAITGTPTETGEFEFTAKAKACFGSNGFEYTGCSEKTKTLILKVSE